MSDASTSAIADRVRERTIEIGGLLALIRTGLWWWLRSQDLGLGTRICCVLPLFPEVLLAMPFYELHRLLGDVVQCLLQCITSLLIGRLAAAGLEPRDGDAREVSSSVRPGGE